MSNTDSGMWPGFAGQRGELRVLHQAGGGPQPHRGVPGRGGQEERSRGVRGQAVHVCPVVQQGCQAGPVPRVPQPHARVPAAGGDDVRQLCAPRQAADVGGVAAQLGRAGVAGEVPDPDGAIWGGGGSLR